MEGMSRINHIVRILSSGIEGVGNRAKYASQVKTLSRINQYIYLSREWSIYIPYMVYPSIWVSSRGSPSSARFPPGELNSLLQVGQGRQSLTPVGRGMSRWLLVGRERLGESSGFEEYVQIDGLQSSAKVIFGLF